MLKGDLKSATSKLSKEWASLPTKSGGSAYGGQRARSMQSLANIFAGNGGGSTYTSQPSNSYNASTYVPEYINLSERIHGNVASTTEEDTKEEAEAKQSIDKVTQEQEMLQNYFTQNTEALAQSLPQQEEQIQAYEAPTIGEQYSAVSQLVDNPIAQEGRIINQDAFSKLSKKQQDIAQKELDFNQNWYANRKQVYDKQGNATPIDATMFTKPTEFNPLIEESKEHYGRYNPETNTTSFDPLAFEEIGSGTVAHEDDHSRVGNALRTDFSKNYPLVYLPLQKSMSSEHNKMYTDVMLDKVNNKDDKYEYAPSEIHSNIQEVRFRNNLKPGQYIDRETMKSIKRDDQWLLKKFDDEEVRGMLNSSVSIDRGTPQHYSQEGGIPVSSQGVYDFPMQEVLVPTSNGEITMKDVDYPILGIDEFGNKQMMHPGKEYKFPGKTIHEIPNLKNYFNKRN